MTRAKRMSCMNCGDATQRGSNRCAACAYADHRKAGGLLPVSCWCEATTVWVRREWLWAGNTRTCGLEACMPVAA